MRRGGGGGDDLEMGMGWGKERWREEEEEEGREGEERKGVLARAPQQMDKCLCFALRHFLLLLRAVFVYLIPPPPLCSAPPSRAVLRRESTCAVNRRNNSRRYPESGRGLACLLASFLPSLSYRPPGSRLWWTGRSSAQVRRNGFGWAAVMFNQQAVVGGGR